MRAGTKLVGQLSGAQALGERLPLHSKPRRCVCAYVDLAHAPVRQTYSHVPRSAARLNFGGSGTFPWYLLRCHARRLPHRAVYQVMATEILGMASRRTFCSLSTQAKAKAAMHLAREWRAGGWPVVSAGLGSGKLTLPGPLEVKRRRTAHTAASMRTTRILYEHH